MADYPRLATLCLADSLSNVKTGCSKLVVFSLLRATFRSTTLHSNDIEFPAGLHCCDSVLDYKKCSWSEISCLTCSRQNGAGKHYSVHVSAKDTETQREAEHRISSACKKNIWGLFPNPRKAGQPASWRAKVSPGRSPAAPSLLREAHLPTPSQRWSSLATLISQRSQIHLWLSLQKRREDSNSSATYDSKNIFACLGSIQHSTVPALRLRPYTLPALAGTATSWDKFFQVLSQSVQGSLAGISKV